MSPGQSLGSLQVTELDEPCLILTEIKCRTALVSECKRQEENMRLLSNMRNNELRLLTRVYGMRHTSVRYIHLYRQYNTETHTSLLQQLQTSTECRSALIAQLATEDSCLRAVGGPIRPSGSPRVCPSVFWATCLRELGHAVNSMTVYSDCLTVYPTLEYLFCSSCSQVLQS